MIIAVIHKNGYDLSIFMIGDLSLNTYKTLWGIFSLGANISKYKDIYHLRLCKIFLRHYIYEQDVISKSGGFH